MAAERIQKVLARAGVASRRAVERLIVDGRITVNGVPITRLGSQIDPARDRVEVDGQRIRIKRDRAALVLAVHKPAGMLTTLEDPQGRPTVGDLITGSNRRVFPVGRLDWDAEGLVLMTDDGDLANRLAHPRFHVARTYRARVKGEVTAAELRRLLEGVRLADGIARASRARIVSRGVSNTWIELTIHQGRNHLVKRMAEEIGHPVLRLRRTRHGAVDLGQLPVGRYRRLEAAEIAALEESCTEEGVAERVARSDAERNRSVERVSRPIPERKRARPRRRGRSPRPRG